MINVINLSKTMPRVLIFFSIFFVFNGLLFSQTGIIQGSVKDVSSNEAIPFANVNIQNSTTGAVTDFDGKYEIVGLKPGLYNVEASYVGYKKENDYPLTSPN